MYTREATCRRLLFQSASEAWTASKNKVPIDLWRCMTASNGGECCIASTRIHLVCALSIRLGPSPPPRIRRSHTNLVTLFGRLHATAVKTYRKTAEEGRLAKQTRSSLRWPFVGLSSCVNHVLARCKTRRADVVAREHPAYIPGVPGRRVYGSLRGIPGISSGSPKMDGYMDMVGYNILLGLL